MAPQIRTVIIPAAGLGTRMLPATKSTPKEMLTVYDRPVIQFAIDEALSVGARRIVVITHRSKPALRDYLTPSPRLMRELIAQGKADLAEELDALAVPSATEVVFVDQPSPRGLGDAVARSSGWALPGPVGVILPDDLIFGEPCLKQMIAQYSGGHMVAAMEVHPEETSMYGIFVPRGAPSGRCVPSVGMVEKPAPGTAPSLLAAVGRYILDPVIFDTLASTPRGKGGEVQLTDAITHDAASVALTAYRFSGDRFDCGSHDGLLEAAIARQQRLKTRDVNLIAV